MDEQNNILIVEDEILVATSIKKYLQDFGYDVINIVASGSKALSVLRENQVNMVLMDIRIKGDIDGIETSAKINELYNLPIVYLTAHTDPKTLERAKKTEPYGYIVKPIEPRNMLSTIEMALYKHKAEGVIKESEERYRTLVEGAGQAIFTVDKDGICLFMNHIAEVKFNESSKPILGKCITNILPQDLAKPLIGLVKDTFKTLKPQITEATCYTDHHQEYYEIKIHPLKNKAGQFDSAMIIAADLSERKKTEKERIRLAKAVEQAAECIIITDKDFKIQYVNPAFEFITGYKRDEVLGKKPNILKSGKHDNTFYKDLYTTITSGNIWHGHFINMKKDNTLYEEEATISPVKDQSGHITNYVAVKRDVTEEIKLEKQLQRAQNLKPSEGWLAVLLMILTTLLM